jgi:hypothetical protein
MIRPCLIGLLLLPLSAQADESMRDGMSVLVTQGGPALIRETRSFDLTKGRQKLTFPSVSPQTVAGSAWLEGPGVVVVSQGFAPANLDQANLLAASLGREATVIWPGGGTDRVRVVAAGPAPLFEVAGKVVSGRPDRIVFDQIPDGLSAVPALEAEVTAQKSGRHPLDLTYMAGGLSWQADFIARLDAAHGRVDLSSWASVSNHSGQDLMASRLRLLAGDAPRTGGGPAPMRAAKAMAAMEAAPPEAVGHHYLYRIDGPVRLPDGQTRQLPLTERASLPAELQYVVGAMPPHNWRVQQRGEVPVRAEARLIVSNALKQPLPAGMVRVFLSDGNNEPTLVGADQWQGVPVGQQTVLNLGRAFDVTTRKVQTDFVKVSSEVTEAAWEVRLANAGAEPAKVLVKEGFGGEWLVLEESQGHVRDDAFGATWTVTVPARGETRLSYRVRVKG